MIQHKGEAVSNSSHVTCHSSLLFIAGTWAQSAIEFFGRMGALGFFMLEALNSSFLYLPLANELLMLSQVRAGRGGAVWALYVLMAAAGSAAGVALVDPLMRKAGEKGLERFVKPARVRQLKAKLKDKTGRVVFFVSLLPPPFPFRPVMLTASALQSPRRKMLLGVFCGRLVRFTVEAALAVYFGRKLLKYLQSDAFEYLLYAFTAVAVAGSALMLWKWLGSGRASAGQRRRKAKGAARDV
ncbi:MAG TPA: VTT domain-containing protein [Pyrinomonadaceae bacterium]|nr:VTT domain-containing protein [Pyrinomonadaceae bacterium]